MASHTSPSDQQPVTAIHTGEETNTPHPWVTWFVEFVRDHRPLAVVIGITLLFQIWFFQSSAPNQFPDSGVYFQTAQALREGNGSYPHFAYRTPGFPAFLALGQMLFGEKGFQGIMGLQFLLGLSVPPLLYGLFRRLTDKRWIAAAGALAFYGDRFSVGMQTVLLTEWLSAWSALAVIVVYCAGFQRRTWLWAGIVGAACAVNILIRPSFSFLPFCLAVGTTAVLALYKDRRSELKPVALWNGGVVVFAYLFTLPWRLFLYSKFGSLSLSFILGISLSNHMGPIMEKAPDSHAEIRDLYVQLRPKGPNQSHMDTGWGVVWEYERRTGQNHTVAATKLQKASVALILRNPGFYLGNLGDAWKRIWTEIPFYVTDLTDPYTTPKGMRPTEFYQKSVLTGPFSGLYQALDRGLWNQPGRLAWIPYLLLAIGVGFTVAYRRRPERVMVVWILLGTVFYHVFVHMAANYTEFGRYRLPVHPLWFPFLAFTLFLGLAHAVLLLSGGTNAESSQETARASKATAARPEMPTLKASEEDQADPRAAHPRRKSKPNRKQR